MRSKTMFAAVLAACLMLTYPALACNGDADCPDGQTCMGGECIQACSPDCEGKQCGPNGCGGDCGYCPDGINCVDGVCDCQTDCAGKQCGPDGCSGFCGDGEPQNLGCPPGLICDGATLQCKEKCEPQCLNKECGLDGCGGVCGTCKMEQTCESGKCIDAPQCEDECATGQTGCEDGQVWVCQEDENGCKSKALAWCPPDETCVEGECKPEDVVVEEGEDTGVSQWLDAKIGLDLTEEETVAPSSDASRQQPDTAPGKDDTGTTGGPDISGKGNGGNSSGCAAGGSSSAPAALLLFLLLGTLPALRIVRVRRSSL